MLRSAASSIFNTFRGVVRHNVLYNAARAMSSEVRLAGFSDYGDGKSVTPSKEGVTGPDAKYLPGIALTHPDYPDCKGHQIPGEAWSDGVSRIIWDKLPPVYLPNPAILIDPARETDEEFDQRFINYFNREDIDNWELRNALQRLLLADCYPDPKITIAAWHACRRLNEFPVAVRWLEVLDHQCMTANRKDVWAYMMQELEPTMKELGIPHLETLGYDKPELWQEDVYDM